jgi:tRNA (mo5U34)-methyltransferase
MHPDELRQRVAALRWYHTLDFGNGIRTPGVDDTPFRLNRLALPERLTGRSVLDVGAWDGFFSFEAERRGAARVVATDHFAWNVGWGTGQGKAGFQLARDVLQSKVEDVEVDVMALSPQVVGTFDVVLFLGVLYHVKEPLSALERVASVTRDLLIVETVVDMVGITRPAAAFYPADELGSDPTNWWGPNIPALHGMLRAVGFASVETVTPTPSVAWRAMRAAAHHLKGRNRFGRAFRQDRAVVHARKRSGAVD